MTKFPHNSINPEHEAPVKNEKERTGVIIDREVSIENAKKPLMKKNILSTNTTRKPELIDSTPGLLSLVGTKEEAPMGKMKEGKNRIIIKISWNSHHSLSNNLTSASASFRIY
ncbi:hypothetical protein TNCT_567801 [Trichonephila clavata]|uniref:Uncharacterized protein n=1 Tax=Trichonephila clavata TaxID=2740835 RepID=A0A8X6IML2_TRICU|nr:hypothetical protein TNCT_567801 [Trichonephila clavata]